MIPSQQFMPLINLDSYFLQMSSIAQMEVVAPSPLLSAHTQPMQVPPQHVVAPVSRHRIPAPAMRWSARPAQAIGMVSDNACAACPHQ